MAMAALSCPTSLAERRASACAGFFRTAFHSSSAAAARFSVSASAECGLRLSSGSCRVGGGEEKFSGAGVRVERRRMITVKAADQDAIDSPLMSSMTTKIKESLKAQEVPVVDAYGDGRHVTYMHFIHQSEEFLAVGLSLFSEASKA